MILDYTPEAPNRKLQTGSDQSKVRQNYLKRLQNNINYHFLKEDMISTNNTEQTLSQADLNHLVRPF